jgi:hypothetical protein
MTKKKITEDCGNKRYKGIKKPKCLNGLGCQKCLSVYNKTSGGKKIEPKKNKTDSGSNTSKVELLNEMFNSFVLTLDRLPDDVREELLELFKDYGSDDNYGNPIGIIEMGIDEWLKGGRV